MNSFFVSFVAVVAVGRFTFTPLRLTMLRLTSMNAASRKNMMSISGMISMRASGASAGSLEPSLTGMADGRGRGGESAGAREFLEVVAVVLRGLDEQLGVIDRALEIRAQLREAAVQ